ncbi:helix-hairpin-helix domain-containing protein [Parasporobacterium paucivorans]|uniref:Pathogenicity locus n=1 Tax=Parasporobacterium paucivorans DSM 15970 TaxID=1122934 RepID=A0A1M6HWJ7_9FIRM|nr:helix-hairpin-helix domain-containing protein [Parasporobacterium paucivorans]SHJ26599.1 Pathogenicity locus [Parasporobacterium paucivorans DSM 15970]
MNKELQRIPGVGKKIAEDLMLIGINSINDLRDKNPEELYERLCVTKGYKIDRCVLYVFRCAVYYADEEAHDPEKLKWWKWKDI